jgi:DNA topoisomerase-1
VRIGRYGAFLQRGEGGAGNTATLPKSLPPADLTIEKALALLKVKAEGPRDLGRDPVSGLSVSVQHGRFGHYVQLGETPARVKGKKPEMPKRASIPAGTSHSEITLADALQLLSLPRDLGAHPDDGEIIVASRGRFGPYVKHGDQFRSLEDGDDVFAITLGRALALLAAPKVSRRRTMTKTVLRSLGNRPDGGAEVKLMDGRYGPYVTDGTVNASLSKGADATALTMADAIELLNARAAAGPGKKGSGRAAAGRARPAAPTKKRVVKSKK